MRDLLSAARVRALARRVARSGRLVFVAFVPLITCLGAPREAVAGWASSGGVELREAFPSIERVVARRVAAKDDEAKSTKKPPKKKAPRGKSGKKTPATRKEKSDEPVQAKRGIDVSESWRGETQVFSPEQLEKLEPILRSSRCQDARGGCTYLENGRPGSEASFAFRLIPWNLSGHRGYLVQNDRCGAGGCDQGLFVVIDGQWRMLLEGFGVLERERSSTHGFSDLTFRPRGHPPVKLVWDGRAYRADGEN